MCEGAALLNQWKQGNTWFSKAIKTLLLGVFFLQILCFYSLSSILTVVFYSSKWWGISLSVSFMSLCEQIGLPPKLGSLIYAVIYVFILWIPVQLLFKKKIYIKL